MQKIATPHGLDYPFPDAPAPGSAIEIAPGILWLRFRLPFRLDHINIYLLEDGDGWAVIDAGLSNQETKDAWQAVVAGPLNGERLTRLIVTHLHPDHIGLAGWLAERFGVSIWTSQTTWLGCLNISLGPGELEAPEFRAFYIQNGMTPEITDLVLTQGHRYLRLVAPLPKTFRRLVAGDGLRIGRRHFEVLSGDGHAPEQLMLYCAEEKLFFSSDQILAKITPNVSVSAVEPDGNPLGLYLRSLDKLPRIVAPDALVLPGHQLPFRGVGVRAAELAAHHATRCDRIAEAVRNAPHSLAGLVPVLFPREMDPHQLSFAFSEVHAHVNMMVEDDLLVWETGSDGVRRVRQR